MSLWRLWGRPFQMINLSLPIPAAMFDLFSSWRLLLADRTLGKLWTLCLHALIWAIGKECNNRVFDNIIGDLSSV